MTRAERERERRAKKKAEKIAQGEVADKRFVEQGVTMTRAQRNARIAEREKKERHENIMMLDFETTPFDNSQPNSRIDPFVACFYTPEMGPVVIWDDNPKSLINKIFDFILSLPKRYTIYAHNGGKFDYMFMLHMLRGKVSFKGRGIMSATIGKCVLRDSYHLIPEKLAAYHKEEFDYSLMHKSKRKKNKKLIIDYLVSDCIYLYEIVKGFVSSYGLKISIGQAAMAELRKVYKVGTLGEHTDASIRPYFFGGRVECLRGAGHFVGDYNLYDVNSMYPFAMAYFKHPISSNYSYRSRGSVNDNTVFVDLTCHNRGALITRTEEGETTATVEYGRFRTTIYEYQAALELGLISNVKIHGFIDNDELSTFENFIVPLYEARQRTKAKLAELKAKGLEDTAEFMETKRWDIFYKLLMNNAYGKFAQNPRRFKETIISDHGVIPEEFTPEDLKEWGYFPKTEVTRYDEGVVYDIWERPSKKRKFNNVGTAASITGAARSILLRAIHSATDPIYCDTDSLICKTLPSINGVEIDPVKLGAWDLEAEYSEVAIAGKKMYGGKPRIWDGKEKSIKKRSKGVQNLTWGDMLALVNGETLKIRNFAPTFTRIGTQFYMERTVRATAKKMEAA